MTKTEAKSQTGGFVLESRDPKKTLLEATGTQDPKLQLQLLNEVIHSLWLPAGLDEEGRNDKLAAAVETLKGIKPADELEGLLATQMIATHSVAMDCLRRAMLEGQPFEGRDLNLKHAEKLLTIFSQQIATLNKHRGKGQQKVTVEHVNIAAGGQAIVGNVGPEVKQNPAARNADAAPAEIENKPEIPFDVNPVNKTRTPARSE